jgi:hypothetical protein
MPLRAVHARTSSSPFCATPCCSKLQKWYLLEYVGDESEIDLACHGHPEFSEFAWMPLERLPEGVVEFKQEVYQQVARHFAPEIARRVAASASHVPRG